jgi:hypothetical protein
VQDLRTSGGDACGVLSNTSFGKNILTNQFAPDVLNGWGVRPSDWTFAVTLQQQVGTRSSLDVTYTRRWYRGFFVIDNRSLQPSDLTSFSIVARRILACHRAEAMSCPAFTTSFPRSPVRSRTSSRARTRMGRGRSTSTAST